MNTTAAVGGGIAGAVALNVLHELYRHRDPDAPRIDLIGEEALEKSLKKINVEPPSGQTLYNLTLAGDLVSNATYYSLIGADKDKNLLLRGALFGLAAGVGAVLLPQPLGLDEAPSNRTSKTQVLTVAWYLVGGLVAAAVTQLLRDKT
ncbi:hypothetical protein GCM10027275_48230 [Rhabdobacter roseus]|uniref:Uncharacterized protein n=1 Tax=Rhabdobacter roseus TaxID=1655419 RepID=A0A840TVF7_9BACT|nr:hypothetical protein [Rhabdobacter roseus]MBB5286885.1 hypothetical protein [Rhabdobacter roseus]